MNIGEEDEQYEIEPLEDPIRREEPAPALIPPEPDEVEVSGRLSKSKTNSMAFAIAKARARLTYSEWQDNQTAKHFQEDSTKPCNPELRKLKI